MFRSIYKRTMKQTKSKEKCNCRLGLLKLIYVDKWGHCSLKLICSLYSLCQEPKTRPSRAILVTRRTACALRGESFDWQKFSQEPISGCSDTVGVRSWNFSYTVCNSRRRIRAASLDSGSWSLSWDAAIWINLSIPYALIPSTPCWHKQHEHIREIKANKK